MIYRFRLHEGDPEMWVGYALSPNGHWFPHAWIKTDQFIDIAGSDAVEFYGVKVDVWELAKEGFFSPEFTKELKQVQTIRQTLQISRDPI
jgi:hypothetical protein